MFLDTQPVDLGDDADDPSLEPFRVRAACEVRALLKQLHDGNVLINLNASDGTSYTTTIWALDGTRGVMSLSADTADPRLQQLIDAEEVMVVGYLESIKLQFELESLMLVHGGRSSALQAPWPQQMYRFQRRGSYRVRPVGRGTPVARFVHPQRPELTVALRIIDVSLGGCALALPADGPALRPGIEIPAVTLELDSDTRFVTTLRLHHVTAINPGADGVRLGCGMVDLAADAERMLQRYIDNTQKRRRMLALD